MKRGPRLAVDMHAYCNVLSNPAHRPIGDSLSLEVGASGNDLYRRSGMAVNHATAVCSPANDARNRCRGRFISGGLLVELRELRAAGLGVRHIYLLSSS